MDQLKPLGWTHAFHRKWESLATENLLPGRVVADFGTSLKVAMPDVRTAELTGKLAHYSKREDAPKVGDWVGVRLPDTGHAVVEVTIPRRSELARKVAGKRTVKQVIAANIDTAFVLLALDNDFSVKRLQRFLYQLSVNHIDPIIVLNKADKTEDMAFYTNQLKTLELPIIQTIATTGVGVEEILTHIPPGKTAILLGSSGVGKSTLTNKLLGRDAQATQAVRSSDATGKHTTVHRELFILPNGGLLIDTPGIRELQLWGTEDELDENFDDISALAHQCKYANCQHNGDQGCAIDEALKNGSLKATHYEQYLKMKQELAKLKQRNIAQAKIDNKKSRKKIQKSEDSA